MDIEATRAVIENTMVVRESTLLVQARGLPLFSLLLC